MSPAEQFLDCFIDKSIKQKFVKIHRNTIKDILKISLPITMSAAVMSITNMIDLGLIMRRLVGAGYSEIEATAMYGNYTTYATPMFNLVISMLTPITIAFMPTLVRENGNKKSFNLILEQELLLTFLISVPLTIGICVYSREILNLLFIGEGLQIGSKLLTYLSLSLFFTAPLLVLNSSLEASGEIRAPLISMTVGSAFKLLVSYILISNPAFGIFGAPIGTLVSYIAALCVSLCIAYKRRKIIPPIAKTMALPAINSFISIIAIYTIYLKINMLDRKILFMLAIFATMVLYAILCLATGALFKIRDFRRQNAQIDN